jgi:hypothetical protein
MLAQRARLTGSVGTHLARERLLTRVDPLVLQHVRHRAAAVGAKPARVRTLAEVKPLVSVQQRQLRRLE